MRSKADGVVMLLGAEPERAGADFLENFDEGGNAGSGGEFIRSGRRAGLKTRHYRLGRFGDQGVGIFAEQSGVRVRDSGEFPAGHGMAAEEERTFFAGEKFVGGLGDAHFGAAGVGDERVRRSVARDFRKKIDCGGDGKREVDQIGVLQSRRQLAGESFVEGAATLRFTNDVGAVPTTDVHPRGVLTERECEGSANQTGAENGDARDEVSGRHCHAMRRPMAGAMMRSSPMSCANWPGSRDCAPSESAWSGSL